MTACVSTSWQTAWLCDVAARACGGSTKSPWSAANRFRNQIPIVNGWVERLRSCAAMSDLWGLTGHVVKLEPAVTEEGGCCLTVGRLTEQEKKEKDAQIHNFDPAWPAWPGRTLMNPSSDTHTDVWASSVAANTNLMLITRMPNRPPTQTCAYTNTLYCTHYKSENMRGRKKKGRTTTWHSCVWSIHIVGEH